MHRERAIMNNTKMLPIAILKCYNLIYAIWYLSNIIYMLSPVNYKKRTLALLSILNYKTSPLQW